MDSDLFKNRNLADDEETIAKTINYLKLNDPENANRDYAIGFLGYMQRLPSFGDSVKPQLLNYRNSVYSIVNSNRAKYELLSIG